MITEEKTIEEQIKYLQDSLIYQMSLGSKELYHSNVWAWLLEKDHEYIKAFFDDIDLNKFDNKFGVRRELAHRDITIWLHKKGLPEEQGKCYLVIENKIKSLPTIEQLQEYTEDLWDNELIGAAYTGIKSVFKPEDVDRPYYSRVSRENKKIVWNFRSYKNIAEKLEEITNTSKKINEKDKSQILVYCKIVKTLNDLLEQSLNATNNILSYDAINGLDDERVRISDVFKKLKGSDFLAYVRERMDELEPFCPKEKGYQLCTWQSYNNKHTTLDIRFCSERKDCPHIDIGIQIEDLQYRRMALIDKQTIRSFNLKSKEAADKLFDLLAYDWFDKDFVPKLKDRTIGGKTTKLKKKYDSYVTQQDCFIYQYCNIDEANKNKTYEDLFDCIKKDLAKAKEVIEKHKF